MSDKEGLIESASVNHSSRLSNYEFVSKASLDQILTNLRNTTREKTPVIVKTRDMQKSDFEFIKTIGKGSFGKVEVARMKETGEIYAMKTLSQTLTAGQECREFFTKRISKSLEFPFIINVVHHFQDGNNLYMVMPFCAGGDMLGLMTRCGALPLVTGEMLLNNLEVICRFYAAQLVLALEFLHSKSVIYAGLKPENVLIDSIGYVKLADFVSPKKTIDHILCSREFPDYAAHEVIQRKPYGKAVDWWSLGVMLHAMVAGYTPFWGSTKLNVVGRIVDGRFRMPQTFSTKFSHLISNLLQTDPNKRLGNLTNEANDVKVHPWFAGVNWIDVLDKKVEAPLKPRLKGETDTSYFPEFMDETNEFDWSYVTSEIQEYFNKH